MDENKRENELEPSEVLEINDDMAPESEDEITFDGPSEDDVPDINVKIYGDTDPDVLHQIADAVTEELESKNESDAEHASKEVEVESVVVSIENEPENDCGENIDDNSVEEVNVLPSERAEKIENSEIHEQSDMDYEDKAEGETEQTEDDNSVSDNIAEQEAAETGKSSEAVNDSAEDDMTLEVGHEETENTEEISNEDVEHLQEFVDGQKSDENPPEPPIIDPKKKSKAPYLALAVAGIAVVALVVCAIFVLPKFIPSKNPAPIETPPVEIVTPEPTTAVEPTVAPTPDITPEPSNEPPEVVETEDRQVSGILVSIGEDTLTIRDDDQLFEVFIPDDVDVSALVAGVTVNATYIEDESDRVLKEITVTLDQQPIESEPIEVEITPAPSIDDVFAEFKSELQIIQGREPKGDNDDNNESTLPVGEKVETMELPMDVGGSGTLWFRFAWAKNDKTTVVPSVNDVIIELQTPSGSIISQENIGKYGRYWLEKNIINFAIKNGKAGQWKFLVTKTENQNLGDISANVLPLSGFITVEKADVNYVGDDLHAIWKISGVKDEEFSIKINAKNANGSDILVYSASTLEDDVHLIDTVKLSTTKLPAGEYDFVITVEDWDCKTVNGKKQLTGKGMTDSATLTGIVIK